MTFAFLNTNIRLYHLFLFSLLCVTAIVSQANTLPYRELPDESRSSIRLQSYLLIKPGDFSVEELDRLIDRNIPLAILSVEAGDNLFYKLIEKIGKKQTLLPVIADQGKTVEFPKEIDLAVIGSNLLDNICLADAGPDSLFSDTLFTFNELMRVIPDSTRNPDSYLLFDCWSQSGKVPNFILANSKNWETVAQIVDSLNSTPRIFGVVKSEEQLLGKVSWKGFANRKTNGYFCFSIESQTRKSFVPYKPGFRFSPDIILDSPENVGYLKEFKAIPLDNDFDLIDHFVFRRKMLNLQRSNDDEIVSDGVKFIHDDQRGDCALFPNRSYIDCGIRSTSSLKPGFSVTAWIKPTSLTANNSILGKGREFVLKLHNGYLTYTMQGVEDYRSPRAKVKINEWTFVSLVHSDYENKMRYYLNGELVDEIDLLVPYTESDHTLLIGSNLWEEFFIGYLDDIKIWDRELNDQEIAQEYSRSHDGGESSVRLVWLWILIPVLAFVLFLFIVRRKRKTSPEEKKPVAPSKQPVLRNLTQASERLLCFGGLKVINGEETDVSLKFSPKLKQLFILVFLYSLDGQKGISTKKLSGILWPGMSPQEAKNTRGTNIQNLKATLASCPNIKLVFREKLWFLEMSDSCYSDYVHAHSIMQLLENNDSKPLLETELPPLLAILKKGTLFPNMSNTWLDPYVSKMSDRIIELGLKLFHQLDEEKHVSLIYELAEVISLNDPLNEIALQKKLQILTRQGKLSLAHTIYDQFVRLYKELYMEAYPLDFKAITNSKMA